MIEQPLHVLLIEDDEDDYVLVRRLLSKIPFVSYELRWAASYQAALEAAGEDSHDVCLLDFRLGERDGLELLAELTRRGYRKPIIFLTGQGDRNVDIEAMTLGASDFLVKGELNSPLLERSIRYAVERKRAEGALRASESKYKTLSQEFTTLLEAIEDSLVLLSPDLKVLWANQGAAYGLKLPSPKAIGQCCYRMIEGRQEPCEDCGALQCFRTGEQQAWMSVQDGRFLDKRAFPLLEDGEVQSVILLVRDITEKMTLQAEAMQASHLASLGELAASVAHEINNPINGIINYAQILANKAEANSKELDISRRIIKEGDRIANIVRSLLSFARDDQKSKGPCSFHEILKDTLTLVHRPMRKEGIQVILEMADRFPLVVVNPQQIQQVILNVINNARFALNEKYPGTHDDKVLKIGGERISRDGRDFLRLSFLDRGTGIGADILNRVMEPFFSTKPSKQGTGLGLSISNRIINDHGGRFEIQSVAGEYTNVIVELPVWEEV